jgi:hypothetical protein
VGRYIERKRDSNNQNSGNDKNSAGVAGAVERAGVATQSFLCMLAYADVC